MLWKVAYFFLLWQPQEKMFFSSICYILFIIEMNSKISVKKIIKIQAHTLLAVFVLLHVVTNFDYFRKGTRGYYYLLACDFCWLLFQLFHFLFVGIPSWLLLTNKMVSSSFIREVMIILRIHSKRGMTFFCQLGGKN